MAGIKQVGRYELSEILGEGGMARVYRAYDPNFKREVALKVMSSRQLDSKALQKRFYREAQTIAALEHRAIVPVYDFGEEDGRPFLVMRLMTGGSLAEHLQKGVLPHDVVQHILDRIGDALDKAHSHDIVHRDLKPGNVLFDDDGHPYLSDFGIVKSASATKLTAANSLIGTPAYMSPEQVLGKGSIDGRSDIYALGAMFFEMLTGHQPYKSETSMGMAMAHLTQPVPRIRGAAPHLSEAYQAIIDRAMAKEPDDRYQRGIDLATAFRSPIASAKRTLIEDSGELTIIEPVSVPATKDTATLAEPVTKTAKRSVGFLWKAAAPVVLLFIVIFSAYMMRDIFTRESELQEPTVDSTLVALAATTTYQAQEATTTRGVATTATDVRVSTTDETLEIGAVQESGNTIPAPEQTSSSIPSGSPSSTVTPTPSVSPNPALPPPNPTLGATWIRPKDGAEMVFVPAGSFQMGSTNSEVDKTITICQTAGENCERSWFEDEIPQHQVSLDSFWIDQYEVTNAQFANFISEMGNQIEGTTDWLAINEPDAAIELNVEGAFEAKIGMEDHPVILITWYAARAYCDWAGGHLPTEAQWEYAAKDPQGFSFAWGQDFIGTNLNYCDTSCSAEWRSLSSNDNHARTAPVGSYSNNVSWAGAYDMMGNVWEWVSDWYGKNYYSISPRSNPMGPGDGQTKVLRGGSWYSPAHFTRTTVRYALARRSFSRNDHGFRCAY